MRRIAIRSASLIAAVCVLLTASACAVAPQASGGGSSDAGSSIGAGSAGAVSAATQVVSSSAAGDVGSGPQAARQQAKEGAVLRVAANDAVFEAELADTAAARELLDLLRDGPVTVSLREYGGFEKVGPLPKALSAEDAQMTTRPGDVMLYQGNQMTIFYGSNTWSYTPLAHVDATADQLAAAFGAGDVDVTLSLE